MWNQMWKKKDKIVHLIFLWRVNQAYFLLFFIFPSSPFLFHRYGMYVDQHDCTIYVWLIFTIFYHLTFNETITWCTTLYMCLNMSNKYINYHLSLVPEQSPLSSFITYVLDKLLYQVFPVKCFPLLRINHFSLCLLPLTN